MRTDKAIQLAIRDTLPRELSISRGLRAWFAPLAWYVAEGRTPPSADAGAVVGHLPRVRLGIQAMERTADAPVLALEACA
jgi:hypothetical protein